MIAHRPLDILEIPHKIVTIFPTLVIPSYIQIRIMWIIKSEFRHMLLKVDIKMNVRYFKPDNKRNVEENGRFLKAVKSEL